MEHDNPEPGRLSWPVRWCVALGNRRQAGACPVRSLEDRQLNTVSSMTGCYLGATIATHILTIPATARRVTVMRSCTGSSVLLRAGELALYHGCTMPRQALTAWLHLHPHREEDSGIAAGDP